MSMLLSSWFLLFLQSISRCLTLHLELGHTYTCVADESMQCFGDNGLGALGYEDNFDRGGEPGMYSVQNLSTVDLDTNYALNASSIGSISAADHTCTISTESALKCWGHGLYYALGNGREDNIGDGANEMGHNLQVLYLGTPFVAHKVTTGLRHTCVWSLAAQIKCWGSNEYGQLGVGNTDNILYPQLSPLLDLGATFTPLYIGAFYRHTCALSATHKVKCWGRNDRGQLGYDDTNNRGDAALEMGDNLPEIDLGDDFLAVQIAVGGHHNCALSTDARVKCWGLNNHGQLGYGDRISRGDGAGPSVSLLSDVVFGAGFVPLRIIAGAFHTCALSTAQRVQCWGDNFYGQLGYGDDVDRLAPVVGTSSTVNVGSDFSVVEIGAGDVHTCALSSNDELKCWGRGAHGRLGYDNWDSKGDVAGTMGDDLPVVNIAALPTRAPSPSPTAATSEPTSSPTDATSEPTNAPSMAPTKSPTKSPSTKSPSKAPSVSPTKTPSTSTPATRSPTFLLSVTFPPTTTTTISRISQNIGGDNDNSGGQDQRQTTTSDESFPETASDSDLGGSFFESNTNLIIIIFACIPAVGVGICIAICVQKACRVRARGSVSASGGASVNSSRPPSIVPGAAAEPVLSDEEDDDEPVGGEIELEGVPSPLASLVISNRWQHGTNHVMQHANQPRFTHLNPTIHMHHGYEEDIIAHAHRAFDM